jgi:hypothetical protein
MDSRREDDPTTQGTGPTDPGDPSPEAQRGDDETLDEEGSPRVEGTQDGWTGKARRVIDEPDHAGRQ